MSVTKREQEIKLDETDFDEKRKTNKRKKLISQGLDPDAADEAMESEYKEFSHKGHGCKG